MAEADANLFNYAIVLLGSAVIAAPLFKRIGLGTVLGYLTAGIVIGPILGFIADSEKILHVAELGVVLLLFIIGLELKPSRLWRMRRDILGMGSIQVLVTGLILMAFSYYFAVDSISTAIVIGFSLALSSTAFTLQILNESGDLNRSYGQKAFSILLFQDIAIIPLLALVAILAPSADPSTDSMLQDVTIAALAIIFLILTGRYLLNPLFQVIASTGAKEAMIAAALFVVLAAGAMMEYAGLSMALGAFIAGVMLSESSFRHELEADIEPFRGILLGLFFMAVGLSLDLQVIYENMLLILLSVPIIMSVKAIVIYQLCRGFGSHSNEAIRVASILPQSGEFGFVAFTAATANQLLSQSTASTLVAIVTISMALTPLVVRVGNMLLSNVADEGMEEDFKDAGSDVLMIGFSRFGQIASQVFLTGGTDVTILDQSAERIRNARKFGFRIYFGDGRRRDVLKAAGIERAKIVAVCTNERDTTDKIVELIRSEYPNVKLFVRSYDRAHTLALRATGVEYEIRETFESGIEFGRKTLEHLGMTEQLSSEISDEVRHRDEERLALQEVDGVAAGGDRILTKPIKPEPLVKPKPDNQEGSN
ncbi:MULTISPECIES: monovalent cation:proton antiporter-2 (CPA2) family protein [unclassified Lentilitoribacter]|jgi:CPA2 family monovalent cation:H+ antiporter-2|uniref:monovalent cation:proton antiporter-2 (CPA2) family protein n=1 Tax=unclassified Lentilitoribacter TaxID=2647570 RepID=UPI0013A6B32B|nr:monovalent cation:proton antiporter-2 (CPA2) family protein [Lentilitoribacter sp. Alg239-R112]